MPPEVGKAETSSDMVNPISRMNALRIGHDQEIEIGPPLFQPAPKFVKHPARIEMIENEMAKFEKPDQLRLRSWRYPSLFRLRSSSEISRTFSCPSGIAPRLSVPAQPMGLPPTLRPPPGRLRECPA